MGRNTDKRTRKKPWHVSEYENTDLSPEYGPVNGSYLGAVQKGMSALGGCIQTYC